MEILQTERMRETETEKGSNLELRGRGRRWHCGKKSATKLI